MTTEDACRSLVEALEARRTDIVKSILDHLAKTDPSGSSLKTVLGSDCTKHGTLLHYAVQANLRDAIRAIMLAGADPGLRNQSNQTVIEMVESPEVLQLFSDELFRAVAASQLDRVAMLLSSGVRQDAVDSALTQNTGLHWAASFGSVEMIELLIEKQFDVNARNSDGCSPLHDAIQRKDTDIVKLLIAAGADTSVSPSKGKLRGKTPRELASTSDALCALFPMENGVASEETERVEVEVEAAEQEKDTTRSPSPQPRQLKCEELRLLWPPPRYLQEVGGEKVELPPHLQLVVRPGPGQTLHQLVDVLEVYRPDINSAGHSLAIRAVEAGCEVSSSPGDLEISLSSSLAAEEYSLTVSPARLRLRAGAAAGLHYGCQTLLQLLQLFRGAAWPQLVIRDRPSMSVRGILLDLALYGRLPTLETLSCSLRSLARLKMSEVHLFTRLTSQTEWQLPYLPQDLISLDRECHDRMIKVYPVLDIPQPCPLSELSQFTAAFSRLQSCLSSRDKLHLGPCLSSVIISAAAQAGSQLVFPSLPAILAVSPATNIVLCSNSLASQQASLLANLPANLGLMEFGFQADYPALQRLERLAVSGCEQLLCAGTSAWNCLVGRPDNMMENIRSAVRAVSHTASSGLVVASWAGSPALAPLSSSLPGWALGLGLAWNSETAQTSVQRQLGPVVSRHLLSDELGSSGQVVLDLGRLEDSVQLPGLQQGNSLQSSLLLTAIMRPNSLDLERTSAAGLGQVIQEVRKCLARLQQSREGGGGAGEGLLQEITLSGELLLLAARLTRALILTEERTVASLQPTFKTDLANKLLSLTEQYRAVWLSRYQPGGMQNSLLHLTSLLNTLLPPHQHSH